MHVWSRSAILGAGLLAGAAFAAGSKPLAIGMDKQTFTPAKAGAAPGSRIVWTNTDTLPHSVTADDKRFDSGPIMPGKTFEWTVSGTTPVGYHCIFHPSMTGVIDVQQPAR